MAVRAVQGSDNARDGGQDSLLPPWVQLQLNEKPWGLQVGRVDGSPPCYALRSML